MKKIITTITFAFAVSLVFAQIKVVAPNGDVGIGTSSPTTKLEVDGNIKSTGALISVGEGVSSGAVGVDVGIGRTGNGAATFDFVSDVSSYPSWGFRLLRGATGASRFSHRGNNDFIFACNDNGTMRFLTDNTTRLTIQSTGQVDIAGSATVNGGVAVTSDRRLKNNVRNFDLGLAELMQLRPVSFSYNGEGGTSATDRPFVGLIAQELQKVAPEFVSDHKFVEKDDDGNVITDETYLKVHDSELKYLMVNAIQEQNEMIQEQQALIEALSSRIEQLELNGAAGSLETINVELTDQASIAQNIPNPFNDQTQINYSIPSKFNTAVVQVFDTQGRLMKTVSIDKAGSGVINLTTSGLASGTYSYNLVVDSKIVETKQMILAR